MRGSHAPDVGCKSSYDAGLKDRLRMRLMPALTSALLAVLLLCGLPGSVLTESGVAGEGRSAENEGGSEWTEVVESSLEAPFVLARNVAGNRPVLEQPTGTEAPATDVPGEAQGAPLGEQIASLPMSPQNPGAELGVPRPGYEAGTALEGTQSPEISPTPGVTFVETMIRLLDHELNGRFWGWRPNDILIGRFTDNINNYQLGVLEALRFTTMRLKDSLTRMGDADTYDPDLEQALNLLMNKATRFWFPSAESSYKDALMHLEKFLQKLEDGQRNFYYRKDTLLSLMGAYKDLLGNVNKSLVVSPVSWFKTDDHFYYAKGVAHVYYEILTVVKAGFKTQLATTLYGTEVMDQILHELHRVEEMNPWIILDSDLDGLLANHRANINAPLSEVLHLMGVMSQL